jgi:tetratricopeptide (TPR) repeat protein
VAAAEVAGATLAALAALVDKSLVRRTGGERYDLHEVIRQGAASHLEQDAEEATATRDRHAAYFAALLADRERALKSPAQRAALMELTAEIDNVRVAWHWAAQRRRLADLRRALPTLNYFHEIRSWYQEAGSLFRQAADVLQTTGGPNEGTDNEERVVLGELLALEGWFAFRYSAFERARELAERSLALLGPQTADAALAEALPFLWTVRYKGGDYDEGARLLQLRIELQRGRGDQFTEAAALLHLGTLKQVQGDHLEAYRLLREALALFRTAGDPVMIARTLGLATSPALAIASYGEAQQLAAESLAIGRTLDDHFSMALALHALGAVAHVEGRYAEARSLLEESVALATAIGYRWHIAPVLDSLAQTLHALGAVAEARRTFLEALAAAHDARTIGHMLNAMLGLVEVLDEEGAVEQALELCMHILQHPERSEQQRARAERLHSLLEERLPLHSVTVIEERVRDKAFETVVAALIADHLSGRSTSAHA